jgi:hypothetical protein
LDQPKKKRMDVPTRMTHSAMDAAVAINSIEFISHLTSYKMKDITDMVENGLKNPKRQLFECICFYCYYQSCCINKIECTCIYYQ